MSVFAPNSLEVRVKKLEAEIRILKRQVCELRREMRGKPVTVKKEVEEEDDNCTIT